MTDDPQKQGKKSKLGAYISFFVRNEAAGTAMKRRTVIDSNNEAHEAVTMSWSWRDTWQEEHKRAFVVAKMVKADLLADVHGSLQKALDDGQSFEHWRKEIVPKLESKWLGKTVGQLWDELSDEEKAKREPPSDEQREKVIAPERLELIFRTNMAVANAAGHYSQLMKTKDIYPYWRYVTRDDARVRTSHRALHNKVYKWDDPFWQTFFPPNGFRCRCHVSPMTKRQVERDPLLHIEQSNIAEDADGRKVLDVGGYYYQNNPGWDYNPGDGIEHLERLARVNEKGRPAQVQADLEADLAKMEAKETAIVQQRKARADKQTKRRDEVKQNNKKTVPFISSTSKLAQRNSISPEENQYASWEQIYDMLASINELPPVSYDGIKRVVSTNGRDTSLLFDSPGYTDIQHIQKTLQKYTTEHSVCISATGKILFEVASGRIGDIDMPISYSLKDCIVIHNHPLNLTFSTEDVDSAIRNQIAELRVVCKNGNIYRLFPSRMKANEFEFAYTEVIGRLSRNEADFSSKEWEIENADRIWDAIVKECSSYIEKI